MPQQHILVYTDDPSANGVGRYNHSLVMALISAGYRVTRVGPGAPDMLTALQLAAGAGQRELQVKEIQKAMIDDAEPRALLLELKPDLVFFSNCCPVSNFSARRTAIELNIPFVVIEGFVGSYLAGRFQSMLPELERQYRAARGVIAVSQENLDLMHRFFRLPENTGIVVHYGRPAEFFAQRNTETRGQLRRQYSIPDDAVVCVTTARLETVKGYALQIRALERLKESPLWPQLYFIWAGTGSMAEILRQKIEHMGLGGHVKLVGQQWDIAPLLDAADIFVLPSHMEGMPLSIMEAMAKGLPVVASAVSGIPEELGPTGRLIADPNVNETRAAEELTQTLLSWAGNPLERERIGAAGRLRAMEMFREELMIERTMRIIQGALLPMRDYVTPGFKIARPDLAFEHLSIADVQRHPWPYLRREIPHNWYCDRRKPLIGFASRDEASILYNTALMFAGKDALEIGCWMGWSACHLALGGAMLDVVDPLLADSAHRVDVEKSLRGADVLDRVHLHGGPSPELVRQLGASGKRWSLFFIDGNHDTPGPLNDAVACLPFALPDAAILFHDLVSPDVREGLDYLRDQGWNTLVYQTMQIMGIAWRGNVTPLRHVPDPRVAWNLPKHLKGYAVSGMPSKGWPDPSAAGGETSQPIASPSTIQFHGRTSTGSHIISFNRPG